MSDMIIFGGTVEGRKLAEHFRDKDLNVTRYASPPNMEKASYPRAAASESEAAG